MVGIAVLVTQAFGLPWIIALMTGIMMNGITPSAAIPIYVRMKKEHMDEKQKMPESLIFAVPLDCLSVLVIFSVLLSL